MDPRQAQVRRRRDVVRGVGMHARYAGAQHRGARHPLVLVHGLVVSSAFLVPALEKLGGKHAVFAPDLPGYGLSAKPPQPYSLERQADYLGAWMDTLGLERAVLVGCSLGTQVVSHLALRRPELVQRTVLMSPTMDPAARSRLVALRRWIRELPYELAMMPLMLRDYARAGLRRAMRTFEMALADQPEERLPRMEIPALVVRGRLDPIVPQRWAEQVTELLPAGRLRVVEKQAHALNFTAPGEFAQIVHEFAGERAPRRRRGAAAEPLTAAR